MDKKKILIILIKAFLTFGIIYVSVFLGLFIALMFSSLGILNIITFVGVLLLPGLIPLFWIKKRKKYAVIWAAVFAVFIAVFAVNFGINKYDESITINTTPNIAVNEYLPFDENSKIVTLDKEASIKLVGDLPIIDGAAAVFPVYSAFVDAVYPETTQLWDGVFEYNNTTGGYELLGEKQTDIFFGAYPSKQQIYYAEKQGTEFIYTPIGWEAFVFFVNVDNPVDNLTTEQVQAIYSGEITNWSQVGGADEEIVAYQRNQGSGSQSMLIRFMDGKPIMEAPTEQIDDFMSGIVEDVAKDYRNKSGSIGFSFRFYLEGIIKNPKIKMLSIDGVYPSVENIKNGKYPIVTNLYAVTYEGNDNENVEILLEWILSDEGQEIIEKNGYVGIK